MASWTARAVVLGIILITAFLHLGALFSDIHRGIPDWHLDSARYLVQCEQYIRGNFKPIGKTPWYTGNPYANILMLSLTWHGLDKISRWMGYDFIPLNKLNLSLVGRLFYLLLSLLMVLILYRFGKNVFHSTTIGCLSALFWALSPLAVSLNHMIKPEIPLTFFVTLAAIAAFNLSEKEHLRYYIFGGIFAGIATALKYNGAIVLGYLFLMHVYRIHRQEVKKLPSSLLRAVLSYKLLLSGIFWAISFYAFEPIFWLDFFKAIHYIRQYLHTAAYTATPPYLKTHGGLFYFLLYSLKTMPHNLWIFARSVHPLILLLAVTGVIIPGKEHRSKINRIALLPALILLILFATKPLIGAEFLLHILPFVYVLAAVGLFRIQSLLLSLSPKPLKPFAFLPLGIVLAACLYASLYEITFFGLGNIRYHAEQWAKSNLKGQCLQTGPHTIHWDKRICEKKPPAARVQYSKTFFTTGAKDIVLKSFNCEKTKPLIHLIRGYKIRVLGTEDFFDAPPVIPPVPAPLFPAEKSSFTRFLNGIDLNPSYNSFLLHPQTTYTWTFVSENPIRTLNVQLANGDDINAIRSNSLPEPVTLLPYEHRRIHLILSPRFPWRSPYFYTVSLRTDHFLSLRFPSSGNSYRQPLPPARLSPQKAFSILRRTVSGSEEMFQKTFRSLFHYNFDLLKPFLSVSIPTIALSRSSTPNVFFKGEHPNDYYLWTKHPLFFPKGDYTLELEGDIILNGKSSVTLGIAALKGYLCKRKFTTGHDGQLIPLHSLKIPFRVDDDTPARFVLIVENNGKVLLNKIKITALFQKIFRRSLQRKILLDYINGKIKIPLDVIETFKPADFPWEIRYGTATTLLSHGLQKEAQRWLLSAISANPLDLNSYRALENTYRLLGFPDEAEFVTRQVKKVKEIQQGPWRFETGLTLQGLSLPDHGRAGKSLPVHLYLSLPAFNGNQTAFIFFEHDNNFYFGKDFSLLEGKRFGVFYKFSGAIPVPPDLSPGDYKVHFTFRIPKRDYRYHLMKNGETTSSRKCFIKTIRIHRKIKENAP